MLTYSLKNPTKSFLGSSQKFLHRKRKDALFINAA